MDPQQGGPATSVAPVERDRGADAVHPLRHLAIIPDGNRRWARRRGRSAADGHRHGFLITTPALLEAIWDLGIQETTLWMFSSANWKRSGGEVRDLMLIFERFVELLSPLASARSVRVRHLGRRDRLPASLAAAIEELERRTSALDQYTVNLALDHGGASDIARVLQALLRLNVRPEDIEEDRLDELLGTLQPRCTAPDLVIRTSGELRLSGFMPFHSSDSELYFTEVLYPDMTGAELARAVDAYYARSRRFGR